jgi:hypothetical protein
MLWIVPEKGLKIEDRFCCPPQCKEDGAAKIAGIVREIPFLR